MKLLFFLLLPLVGCGQTAKGRAVAGEAYARGQVRQAVREPANFSATVLPTKQVAVAVAEAIFFPIYGQRHIENERPYKVYFIDGCWYISGTLPTQSLAVPLKSC